jgi:hypothetical protein
MRREIKPPTEDGFVQAIENQLATLKAMAEQLDTRGYCLCVSGLNKDARNNAHLNSQFAGAFASFTQKWALDKRRKRRFPIIVWLFPGQTPIAGQSVFDVSFNFYVEIPNRQHFRIINLALQWISHLHETPKFKTTIVPGKTLSTYKSANRIEYRGQGKANLRTMLRVFEIPLHRKILLTGDSNGELSA